MGRNRDPSVYHTQEEDVMRESKVVVWIVGAICGIELLVAAMIGGAGLGSLFGVEGAIVAAATGLALAVGGQRLLKACEKVSTG